VALGAFCLCGLQTTTYPLYFDHSHGPPRHEVCAAMLDGYWWIAVAPGSEVEQGMRAGRKAYFELDAGSGVCSVRAGKVVREGWGPGRALLRACGSVTIRLEHAEPEVAWDPYPAVTTDQVAGEWRQGDARLVLGRDGTYGCRGHACADLGAKGRWELWRHHMELTPAGRFLVHRYLVRYADHLWLTYGMGFGDGDDRPFFQQVNPLR
jgi:hypothetical protein